MAQFTLIKSKAELDTFITNHEAVLLYFSADSCAVCHALKPKVEDLLLNDFPLIQGLEIDCTATPGIPAGFSLFTVPSVLVFFEQREWVRLSQNMSLQVLKDHIQRPYEACFKEQE